MNKPLITFLFVAVLGLGAGFFHQSRQAASLRKLVAQLQSETAATRATAAQETQRLNEKVETYKAANEQLETHNRQLAAAAPVAAPAGKADQPADAGGFASMMKKMFTDPDMKKTMRAQQTMGIQMMYGDLAKELGLAPDDARQVMEILADRQMAMSTEGMKMFGGEAINDADARKSRQATEASNKEFDARLEGILGKDGVAKLKDYELTMGDRMQLQQFKQAFSATGLPLDGPQADGLLAIMKEERRAQPPSPLDPANKDLGAAMQAMQSDEIFDTLMKTQDDVNQRVARRAATVLSPDQMTQFEQIQKQQLEMQKMGMKMGREMMKGKK